MRTLSVLASALAVAAGPGLAPAARAADTTDAPAIGGLGGAPFRSLCAPGTYLVGVRVRHGAWIDAIAPVCADWLAETRTFGPARTGAWVGGDGGSPGATVCGGGAAIAGLRGQQSTNDDGTVGWLRPDCRLAYPPYTDWQDPWGGAIELGQQSMRGGLKRAVDERLCPPETVGVGLYGRAGLYVDRLGIVCAPAPGAAPPMVLLPPRPAPTPAPRIVPPRSDTITDPHPRLRRPSP